MEMAVTEVSISEQHWAKKHPVPYVAVFKHDSETTAVLLQIVMKRNKKDL